MTTQTENDTNLEDYFVLYYRNHHDESIPLYKENIIYRSLKLFSNQLEALEFAKSHSPHPQNKALVAKTLKNLTDYKKKESYIVAAFTAIEGTCAPNRDRYVAVRCGSDQLDSLTEKLVNTRPTRMYLGLEERVDCNALDIVRSVNIFWEEKVIRDG